ncbi:LOW QUALITY PROTEIN: ATP-binding cassette sub-family C member 10-like [Metopolophium dirhodum]|uniref:LOW QUALITY PROTEIN: ATP-binding cassette sub-family C member 10-like n=1 Tax=Metopolophium dirhodum TaxID=44670 RepID=UPI0029904676|nr:LOW QUALITY PROTEIN: ATP-binding cassette sub-family C member 10-like [Metopolophium dirhodum]
MVLNMKVTWNWTELCGPDDFVPIFRPGYVLSICGEMAVIRLPILFMFLLTSTYYCAHLSDWIIRTRRETNVLRCRIIIASMLSMLPAVQLIWEVYKFTESQLYPIENLVLVIQCFTWFIHTLYIVCIVHHLGTSLRGSKVVIIAWFLCFLSSIISLRSTLVVFIESNYVPILQARLWFTLFNWMLQAFYFITMLFKEDTVRIRHVDRLRFLAQQSLERRSLMTSSYSRFNDEFDPYYLGMACDNEHYGFMSWLTFGWVGNLITKGDNKRLHHTNDLFDLPEWLTPVNVSAKVEEVFRHQPSVTAASPLNLPADHESRVPKISLLQALHKCYGKQFYGIGLLKLFADIFRITAPIFLRKLITFVSHHEEPISHGYIYMAGLVLMSLISIVFVSHYEYQKHMLGIKIRGALVTMIYKKTLELNTVTLNNFSIGEIVNFISTDTTNLVNACNSFHSMWSVPFQLVVVLYLLYQQLGIAFLSGVFVTILLIPINKVITSNIGKLSGKLMKEKDKRVKLMSEIIKGIRVIKFHVWEKYFIDKVMDYRKLEVLNLKKRKYLDALCVYFFATTPITISMLTFSTYIFLGGQLTASKVFTSMALLHMLITPLNTFPSILNGVTKACVSVKRIQRLIEVNDLQTQSYYSLMPVQNGKTFDNAVSLTKCSFNWGLRSFQLTNINFSVTRGSFVGIVGPIGSGKSTLLAAILGEMNKDKGIITSSNNMRDGFAFVAQTPWIQKGTIKDNILFGQNFSLEKYKTVIKSCGLVKDLKECPRADLTLIGESGVTLSGGQKARLALARAVYQNKFMYLMDDIFASVDINVAQHLYTHCINGLLKDKTRIICTHNSQFLLSADWVLIMNNGTIVNQGRPFEVLNDYDVKAVDVKFEEANSNSYLSMDDWTPIKESEIKNDLNDIENQEEGVVDSSVYKRYWKSVGNLIVILLFFAMIIMQGTRNISDLWLSHWVNEITNKHYDNAVNDFKSLQDENNKYLYTYILIGIVNSVATFFKAFIFAYGGIKACKIIHDCLLTSIMNVKTTFFDVNPLGRILNRFSSDTNVIDDSLPFILNIFIAQFFHVIGTLGSIIFGVPWAIIIAVILTPVYYKLQKRYRNSSRELKRISTVALSSLYNHINESFQGLATIHAFRAVSRFERENEDKLENFLKTEFSSHLASLWFNFRIRIIGITILFFISSISVFIHQWNLTNTGYLGLSLTYALTLTNMLGGLVSAIASTECDMISLERVLGYSENIENETDVEDTILPPFAWPTNGIIQFSNVFLKYRHDGSMSLNGVSFETTSSEKIGVIGRTGAGKSSLLAALCKMFDVSSGTIFIDDVDLSKISPRQIRNRICVIPQDPFLFDGTIRENIDPFKEYMDSNIWSALSRCHLVATVKRLGGLGCYLGDNINISVGEKQLLCLVRAILKNVKVVCVDEATANVDEMTDRKIQETIRTAFKHSTVITIAHRIRTVMDSDRILVMDNGKVIEFESPNVLLEEKNSYFYNLVQQEFK